MSVNCAFQREARLQAARQWTLLLAFCAQHGLPLDCSRLARLAAANDWIFFLAQASTHFLSLKQVPAPLTSPSHLEGSCGRNIQGPQLQVHGDL